MKDVNIQYFEKADTPKHREFINSQNNCILCNTVLEVLHVVDKATGSIKEEAHCPECGVRTRAKIYTVN